MTTIPLIDLKTQYSAYKHEFDTAIERCISSTSFIGGTAHAEFREAFAKFCGGGHAALCGNGTDALYLAIRCVLGQGDNTREIILPSHTFIATAEAIIMAGYVPVFVDIDPHTWVMTPEFVVRAITPRTKGILPVHLYGQMVDMEGIMEIAADHGLAVIEDAAQAHGAYWKGKGPGMYGDAACFSFYPGKNLGAWGDGGAIFTRDKSLAEAITMAANHGRKGKYFHETFGFNSRLDGIQAAVLNVKIRYLREWNERRRQIAALYDETFSDIEAVVTPTVAKEAEHVFHLYVIQVPERDRVLAGLHEQKIGAGIHYPVPLHEQPVFKGMGIVPEALPVTHKLAGSIISLPIFPEMTPDQVDRVAQAVLSLITG